MTDIVQALKRVGAERQRTTAHDNPDHYLHVVAKISNADGALMLRAAEEIERVREWNREIVVNALDIAAENERLREALKDARVSVEGWADYASDYIKERWDLKGDLARIDAALERKDD